MNEPHSVIASVQTTTALVVIIFLGIVMPSRVSAQTFNDVPTDYWAYSFIETLVGNGITAGCGNNNYCPEDEVTRAQMAVFLERGINGSSFSPPAATGNVFLDVGAGDFAASFIEQFFADGITAGCGNNRYCPDDPVTRGQMAVFLLRAKYGAGYAPPPPITPYFGDVGLGDFGGYAAWIYQLAAEGITAGCGNGNYCPDNPVTRAQMAVFLVRTFGLVPPPVDTDKDGVPDQEDAFPFDPTEWLDTDADGVGNNADPDDDNDGALDDFENSCGTDPLDPNDVATDVNGNGECDNLESDKLEAIGITPRFVRFSNFSGTQFRFHAKAVGAGLHDGSVSVMSRYWTTWMSGGNSGFPDFLLNDDMLNGDLVAGDYNYSAVRTFGDIIMPAATVFADGAFHMQQFSFQLVDGNGGFIPSAKAIDGSFEIMLLRDDIPNVTLQNVAPNIDLASHTAFIGYDESIENVGLDNVTQDYFTHFEDANIVVISHYAATTSNGNPGAAIVSNDVGGLGGIGIFDSSSAWGSEDEMQLLVLQKDNMAWTIPHEVGHRWGFYANEPVGISSPRGAGIHFAVSNIQGQMQGSTYLEEQMSGDFIWRNDDGNGGFLHRTYSDWMQYLACDLPKASVGSMWIINPDFESMYSDGSTIPRAHMTEITIDDFTAIYGERSVVGNQCQTVFTVGFIVVYKTDNPPTDDDYTGYNEMHKYVVGTSAGQGLISGGIFTQPDMISLNAAMSGGNINFVNGLVRRSMPAASSKALDPGEGIGKAQTDDGSVIFVEEPIGESVDFSEPDMSSISGEVQ